MTDEIQSGGGEAVEFEGVEFTNFDEPEPRKVHEPETDTDEPEESADESTESKDEQPEPSKLSESEAEARSRGWTSKAEWLAAGKDAEDWVSHKHFNEKGRLISQARKLEQLEKTFDNRINNVKVLYDAQAKQLKAENARLLEAKNQAIDYGDRAQVEQIDKQLLDNAINMMSIEQAAGSFKQPSQPPQEELEKEAAWERNNQWINTQDPASPEFGKATYTRNLYAQLLQQYPNSTADERIAVVEREVAAKFPVAPKVNQARQNAVAVTDSKTSKSVSNGKLTMADLTPDESKQWNQFGKDMFGTKEAFLQAVSDSRRSK